MEDNIIIRTHLQHRRATAARWAEANPVLREGEIGLELDTHRMKFGNGITAWNNLEYATHELLPASGNALGGITAASREQGFDVEAQIDPRTHRMFVPAYPHVPELAPVATSNDYNDLDNIPASYSLPPAAANVIGGVTAVPKTSGYIVEVKKDPANHRLYVPATNGSHDTDEGTLPGLVIRVIYKHQPQSEHFTNETGEIQNADIYFRPQCSPEHFKRIMPHLSIGLARCTSRHRQSKTKGTAISQRSTGWHIVGRCFANYSPQTSYPQVTTFTGAFNDAPRWTFDDTPPVAVSSLIETYDGEWIKFPYDLETIVRRFVYIYQKIGDDLTPQYEVLPIQTLQSTTAVKDGYIKISCIHNRTPLAAPRSQARDYYVSVNLGFCFCQFIENHADFQHFNLGPIAQKRAMVVAMKCSDPLYYFLKDPHRKKRV